MVIGRRYSYRHRHHHGRPRRDPELSGKGEELDSATRRLKSQIHHRALLLVAANVDGFSITGGRQTQPSSSKHTGLHVILVRCVWGCLFSAL